MGCRIPDIEELDIVEIEETEFNGLELIKNFIGEDLYNKIEISLLNNYLDYDLDDRDISNEYEDLGYGLEYKIV